jgi:hypothetical protein
MSAWSRLLAEEGWCRGKGAFPLPAYSEYLPPPYLFPKPYGGPDPLLSPRADECGWRVSEYEEEQQLWPGMEVLARDALRELVRLGRGEPTPHVSKNKLRNNPYWPAALARHAGRLSQERYVLLLSAALSRTQDDKGRLRWTLFGGSEQGPGKAFWRGFFTAPGVEAPAEESASFLCELLSRCYGVAERTARDPARAGLRVLPAGTDGPFRHYNDGPLPGWAEALRYRPRDGLAGVRFLLTFRPFALLPEDVQNAYVAGELHLLPFPGSLLFWGVSGYRKLQKQLPFAAQIPLLQAFARRHDPLGLRIPQSGWLHEKRTSAAGGHDDNAFPEDEAGPRRPRFVRTHRWQKVLRHENEVALASMGDRVTHVLFSTDPDDLELYNKPMARNAQVWTRDYRLVLDGPRHGPRRIERAEELLARGGVFGYRFLFPAMRVGPYEVYWHRPVCAFAGERPDVETTAPAVLLSSPTGYLTAYRAEAPNLSRPVELWPRFLDRPERHASVELFRHETTPRRWHTTSNVRALLAWRDLLGGPLPADLARALLALPQKQTLDGWLDALPGRASDPVAAADLVQCLRDNIAPAQEPTPETALTFDRTATRDWEEAYWRTIALLAHGKYRNKCNADCVRDAPTRKALAVQRRELDLLARYLLKRHQQSLDEAAVEGAWAGEHAFSWRTDFDFTWMGGWQRNQKKPGVERNLVVRIPGRDPTQAVIMADHYDTAYMHDHYYEAEGGTGARVAAAGADDNHSATAMLLLAAPVLLGLSKAGKLGCDVWLVHLTGEEFPSDCLGARHLASDLVQGTLRVKEAGRAAHDLSGVRVRGLFVSDMIAHNNDRNKYVFQVSPAEGSAAARLARTAHEATSAWNALAKERNRAAPRRGAKPFKRSDDPERVPDVAPHAVLRDEVRPDWDPRSTLFNTDGQIFSDVGVPAVLFMEDYDINRKGYHDSYDTMGNIDLDYGAALSAVVVETVARAAQ